jgi:hypothetical protein
MTPRFFSSALCLALIAAAGSVRTTGVTREPANGVAWDTVIVPGGFAAARQAISLRGPLEDWRTIPLLIELSYRGVEGLRITRALDTYSATLRRLRSGGGSLETPDAHAPLPLGTAFWERRFEPVPPPYDMLWAILASREMASLYYGLLGLDGPTLQAIAGNAKLEAALVGHALIVPTIAPVLRIDDGRVRTPGGPDAAHLWQDLVGKSVDRPAEFLKALLAKDEGRLAYFFATIAALPAASAEWVMGGKTADGDHTRKAFRRSYDVFRSKLGEWRPNAVFPAPRQTPAEVLFALTMTDRRTLAGPAPADFWRRALESDAWPADATHELGGIDEGRVIGTADLLEVVCPGECDPARLGALVLLQSESPEPLPADAPRLLLAARARIRYPALALEIERMKLEDLDVYRQLGGLAAKIEGLDSTVEAVALVQFQAAVAMLARVRALGAPADWIRDRIRSLADLRVGSAGFDGELVRWLDTSLFLPASGETPHDAAERLLSGGSWQKPGATFEWEGLRYRVDIAATERERLREAGERFSSNSLTAAVGLLKLADGVSEAVTTGRLDAFEATLKETADGLAEMRGVAWTGTPSAFDSFRNLPTEVMRTLRGARDRDRLPRAAGMLRRAADIVAADAAIALVYACALQDPNSALGMSRELPRRHRLGREPASAQKWTPWSMPFERQSDGGARHIGGAILALDTSVPQLSVRRMRTSRPEQEPNLGLMIADGLWRTAAVHAEWTVSDEEIAALDGARERGAALVEGWSRAFDERILDRAGIAGPRAGWLRWSAARGAIDDDVLRLEDLVRLAGEGHPPASRWGARQDVSRCLCAGMPRVPGEKRGPPGHIEVEALSLAEPSLRVARELRVRRAPAALAPGVLMLFTAELVDHAIVPFPTDVHAVIGLVHQVPSARFDDFVAAVAARGPLVPIEEVER